jgi:hypothetical protein
MTGQEMRWKVGDQLQSPSGGVVVEIVSVRPGAGYDWRYPSMGEMTKIGTRNLFSSDVGGTDDPLMLEWRIYDREKARRAMAEWEAKMDTVFASIKSPEA